MIAAALAAVESEPAPRVRLARAAATQMHDGSEILLLLRRRVADAVAPQDVGHRTVQQRRGHFHRVARYHARVGRVEPARPRVVPGAVLDHDVVVDAVASGFGEGAVGDLKHADSARGRPVQFEWVPTEPPPPISACHWVATALHLGQ